MIVWFIKRVSVVVVVGFVLASAYVFAITNPDPWAPAEVARLAAGLNEAAAIGVPHGYLMRKEVRAEHLALLQKVESGEVLSETESIEYRHIFQNTLHDSQRFLSSFDGQLTILDDVEMSTSNNVAGQGIAGHHDHHDVSARENFQAMLHSLQSLEQTSSSFSRIASANMVQKDLVDLISHMGIAPHSVSVPYVPPDRLWADSALGDKFEAMTRAFKDAQFSPINSPPYWAAIDEALAKYGDLILAVQTRVVAHTSSLERRIAGRFMSFQTGAPPVDINRPMRRK
jgi:hypothetical protein